MTGAQYIAQFLKEHNLLRVFTVPGLHLLPLLDAITARSLHVVLAADERGAAFMADGQWRSGGPPGVILLVPGPGVTNALTAIAEAKADGSAIRVLVVIEDRLQGHGPIHELDHRAILQPVVRNLLQPKDSKEVSIALFHAYEALTKDVPGPIAVLIPHSTLEAPAPQTTVLPQAQTPPSFAPLSNIISTLNAAQRIGIYVGAGCFGCEIELRELAIRLGAPVATTISGRGVLPEDHPLSVGVGFGPGATPWAVNAFAGCDLLLALGCRFSAAATAGWSWTLPEQCIHIDRDPANIQAKPSALGLVGELRHILPTLLQALPPTPRPLRPEVAAIPHARKSIVRKTSKHVEPRIFLETLRSFLARDTPLICDSGNHLLWSIQEFPVFASHCFLCPADFQAMGFGLPAAIGVALNRLNTPTVAIIGDGGLLMSAGELATLARLQIPLCVIVWNDGALGLIRSAQAQGSQYRCASSLQNPDFAALATAHGFTGLKISTPDEILPVLQKALSTSGPVLVDVLMRYPGPTRMARAIALAQWRRHPWPIRFRWARQWIKNRFILPPEV